MRHVVRYLLLAASSCVAAMPAQAQSTTWRNLLTEWGFKEAIVAPGVPRLDSELTSSAFDTSNADSVIGAYYFVDELGDGRMPAPLHASRYDRKRGWIHAPPLEGRGSVLSAWLTSQHIVLHLHLSPSAGQSFVLDASTLVPRAVVEGTVIRELRDGSLLYSGQMIHFAPTHQATLHAFDFGSNQGIEIFPGSEESLLAVAYRRKIEATYAKLPKETRDEIAASYYGVNDFDRELGEVVESSDGRTLAFTAQYACDRLGDVSFPELNTVVRCRRTARAWDCRERKLQDESRRLRIPPEETDKLLRAVAEGS